MAQSGGNRSTWNRARVPAPLRETTRSFADWLTSGETRFLVVHYWDPPTAEGPAAVVVPGRREERQEGPADRGDSRYTRRGALHGHELGALRRAARARRVRAPALRASSADHGEGLGRSGGSTTASLYQEQIKRALIVKVPGRAPTHRSRRWATSDIYQTVLRLHRGCARRSRWRTFARALIEGRRDDPRLGFATRFNDTTSMRACNVRTLDGLHLRP